jgi:hypothetical protein
MRTLIIGLVLLEAAACQPKKSTPSGDYIDQQLKVIESHAELLKDAGRMPVDFVSPYLYIGAYDWHSTSGRGYFGAYAFYQPAFDQASRSWFVHAMMKKGSDLLVAINRNAEFIRHCRYRALVSQDGGAPKEVDDCDPAMNSPVGFTVSRMYQGPEDAVVVEVVSSNTLRLSKKSPGDVLQYDVAILPSDYVDMCACHAGYSTAQKLEPIQDPRAAKKGPSDAK